MRDPTGFFRDWFRLVGAGKKRRSRSGISSLRGILYLVGRLLGDIQAIFKGRFLKRILRRTVGRLTGRHVFRKLFK